MVACPMPIAPEWAYFDHVAVGPLSNRRRRLPILPPRAEQETLSGRNGPHKSNIWRPGRHIAELREDKICMVPNTTTGITTVAEGLDWRNGDSVVVPEGDYNCSMAKPKPRCRGPDRPEDGKVTVDSLMDQVDDTRLISVSWLATRADIEDLQNLVERPPSRGTFTDAIQGLGIYPDLQKLQSTSLPPMGTNGCSVQSRGGHDAKRHLNKLRCRIHKRPRTSTTRSIVGTQGRSIKIRGGLGDWCCRVSSKSLVDPRRHRQIWRDAPTSVNRQHFAGLQVQSLTPQQTRHQSGIVTFAVPGLEPAKIRKEALRQKVVVSCRDGGVRAAVHAYNDEDDIQRLLEVVRSMNVDNQ